ncbi:YggS family pyridoxal phosphate enzyme [Candidatus Pacearchaeota archaeon RBG_19FT_COMBO_34_9]|nr:MAG: YggS family pyridoxal phosphate enzyme [Candidatus Pacearchaeota archaeon RBG_19FT_COMBO_34_9]OGJ16528.1 MAG: YggS family pyridoxal phosphate enzyme [Candidatus Pacearchaeota archaeon RBG_13_33_26]
MFNKKEYKKIKTEIPESVKILAATKTKPAEDITEAINLGVKIIGENYVQEAEEKYEKLKDLFKEKRVSFHLIGHLQTNKIKEAVRIFDCIETVDSERLAEKINKICNDLDKNIDIMIEINFEESQKSGITIEEIDSLIKKIKTFQNLNLIGFMAIPGIGKEKECFEKMKELKEKYNIKELSMGMSSDYKTAIGNGATIIRLGTILFGGR